VSELAADKGPDASEPNVLGIAFDELTSRVFRLMLEGHGDAGVLAALAAEYEDVADAAEDIRELCEAFRQSLLFAPLFREEERAAPRQVRA
jgi:hypothetical protein